MRPLVEQFLDDYDYDCLTGVITRRTSKGGVKAGTVARCGSVKKYVLVTVNGKQHYAHRLIWEAVYGSPPVNDIDHADCDKSNNQLSNLRAATRSQNMANTPPIRKGLKGAYRMRKKWIAKISNKSGIGPSEIYLGCFHTEHEAHEAYMRAASEKYGEFARAF